MNKAFDDRGYMIGIDLHGVKHKDVERAVHDAICQLDLPFVVITGHSNHMRRLVREAVRGFGLKAEVSIINDARMVVSENR
tara:strand:+ start:232 stop:474 length:243 start_codon:yes stop_codon:yes gene_type:complete